MTNLANQRNKAVLLLILTASLWSTSGLWIKVISWSPLAILGARSFVAAFVMFFYLGKPSIRMSKLQILGSFCYIATQFTFVWATKLTTAANAIFLQYASPLYVVVLAYLFIKEKPRKADLISMALIFTGLLLFFGDRLSFDGMYGNILAIISGMTFSVVMLIMRAQRDNNPGNIIFWGNIFGFVIGLPAILGQTFTLGNVGIILYLGIFQIGLSFVFYTMAIKHVRALEANLILTLEPILNPVWVFLVLGEKPGAFALVGSLIVVGAVIYRSFSDANEAGLEPSAAD